VVIKDFHEAYQQFLTLTYLWAPAWAAVVLLAFFVVGEGRPAAALTAWLVGTLTSLVFVNYPNIFQTGHFPNQPLIDALNGADLSGIVSVVVAAGVYLGLRPVMAREAT
jgi:NCS1 family nucleobase:cation symporter-1